MSAEQRKRFEKWFTDTVLRRAPQPGQRFERDDVGGYIDPTVHDMWRGYVAGEQARDAEVQALRGDRDSYKDAFERVLHSVGVRDDEIEELEERIRKLREALEKVVKTEIRVVEPTYNPGDALIRLAGALVEARGIARAALAGGEAGEAE